jgi:V8-like Glu-specific endopeptidase
MRQLFYLVIISVFTLHAFAQTKTICGTNSLQHVSEYNGSKKQPVEFVARHEQAVGAMAVSSIGAKFCSGTLISQNLFLTAAHCINEDIQSHYVVFNFQKKKGSASLEKQESFKIISVIEKGLGGLDYAILKLSGTPGKKYGYALINTKTVNNGNILTVIQHPKGQVKQVDIGHKTQIGSYMSYPDLDTEPGSSGSGVLDQNGYLVGVHVRGGCGPTSGANRATPMISIARLSKTIRALAR